MSAPNVRSTVAQNLLSAGTEAFHEHLLPAIRDHIPEIEGRILVSITSSVATGTADESSDLDMFVIFPLHADYLRFERPLTELIGKLDLDAKYGAICDKGMRFELESLHRADLASLYHRPYSLLSWHRQTPWLLNWLLESVPIYDPQGIHETLHKRCGRWPAKVLTLKQEVARARIRTWGSIARHELEAEGVTYITLRATARVIEATIELAYLLAERFEPHPKWQEARAQYLLGSHEPSMDLIQSAMDLFQSSSGDAFNIGYRLGRLVGSYGLPTESLGSHLPPQLAAPVSTDNGQRYWLLKQRAPDVHSLRLAVAVTEAGEPVYLAQDTGFDRLTSNASTYDRSMRISDTIRWSQLHGNLLAPTLREDGYLASHKRWLYYNFVIWRKLRVVDKAHRRGQPLTAFLFQHQVLDHLIEAFSRLNGDFAPPIHLATPCRLSPLPAELRDTLCAAQVLQRQLAAPEAFSEWGWELFRMLQKELTSQKLLPTTAAVDPLATQWDIQYWKYEDQFS